MQRNEFICKISILLLIIKVLLSIHNTFQYKTLLEKLNKLNQNSKN